MRLFTGVDLLEIARMQKSLQNPRFLDRFFSDEEQRQFVLRGRHPSFLAGCFCVKEAFAKALGTGVRGFSLREVSVLRDTLGKPYLQLTGRALEIAEGRGLVFDVSISNTKDLAMAFVVGYEDLAKKEL